MFRRPSLSSLLQNLNLAKQYERATTRLSDHERFKGILAQGDVEGADRLVRVAMQNHRSISEIVARMSRAACGLYQAKSFQDKNYDVMALAGALGGPKLQYAMAEALGLPAISTTSSRSRLPSLEASIGFPRLSEYAHNLLVLHNAGLLHGTSSGSGQTRRRGWQAMIDEIALEERPRYDSRRDAILGIARETSHEVDITTVTLETLHGAADALNDGSLALAKEATFVGLAAYGRDDYTVLPVMISGTNKTERDHSQARWIQLAIDAWDAPIPDLNTTYEEQYGELWALGSDGDATRRRALHYLLMSETLSPNDRLYDRLGMLPRMNLQCGQKARTMTIDFKHKFKNFASLLRGNSGPLVADHHVTPTDLKRKFAALLDYSEKKITTLFNHKDHQNVPIAVQLLLSLKKLALVEGFTNAVENRPLALLGHFVGYLVEPFITPTLSLSEQLTMLSAAAHLCCLLYRRNRTSFCPGQWYYDMQTFIKNIFWTTAKMKLL
ncbi:uncharacterized protein B0H18DRAFT_889240, partial [Fomitopsis serialis]|uniref:uncharacterized protein n=1 Tax=Fomitopsis serialis TaxID=139415 RepID=UPI0020087A6C